MKLYVYDHCPFCVRARMAAGLLGSDVETLYLPNDDEATPISMTGVKVLPILQKPDGSFMGESLDIVRYFNEQAAGDKLDENVRPEIQAWFDRMLKAVLPLVWPRDIQLGLPEFPNDAAIAYFREKKTAVIGDFDRHLADTPQLLAGIAADLAQIDGLIHSPESVGSRIGMEDILVFPLLRNLTMVRGLQLPAKTAAYVENMSKKSGVPLFAERAV